MGRDNPDKIKINISKLSQSKSKYESKVQSPIAKSKVQVKSPSLNSKDLD